MTGDLGRGALVAGFDIGGTNVRGLLVDAAGDVVANEHRLRPATPDGIVDGVAEMVATMEAGVGEHATAVGVGCAGTVDRRGVVRASPNIPTLVEFALADELRARLTRPVVVDNDATAATWAEFVTGAARDVDDAVFVALGTGIGAGLVLDGELRRGANGFAGEAGHMIVDPAGPECVCGRRGCWEMFGSAQALGRLARRAAQQGRAPELASEAGGVEAITSEHVANLVAESHPEALAVLDELGWWVGLGITNLVDIVDVSMVVVGGGLIEMGSVLIDSIRRGFRALQHDLDHRPEVHIVAGAHGSRAGAVGAALLAASATEHR